MARNAQRRAKGGRVFYEGGSSNVAKTPSVRKSGGAVCAMDDKKSAPRIDKRARGGGVGSDKSPYSSAGGGGATKHPFSSAHRGK